MGCIAIWLFKDISFIASLPPDVVWEQQIDLPAGDGNLAADGDPNYQDSTT